MSIKLFLSTVVIIVDKYLCIDDGQFNLQWKILILVQIKYKGLTTLNFLVVQISFN